MKGTKIANARTLSCGVQTHMILLFVNLLEKHISRTFALCVCVFFLLTPLPTVFIKNNFNIVFALLHTGKV